MTRFKRRRHVSSTSPRGYSRYCVDGDCLRETASPPRSSPSSSPPRLLSASLLPSSLASSRGFSLLALVSPPFPPRVPGHSSLPRGLQSPFIPFPRHPSRAKDVFSLLAVYTFTPYFPRSSIQTRYISRCPLSIRLSLPMVPTTGSTFPSSRHDSVSVSSIFPLSQCPERLNTNAFIVGTTTDVRRMTSPAWAHPRAREREKGRKRWRDKEKERERESFSYLSLQACPLFSHLLLFSFIPANSTPPVSVVRVYLLYLSPFLLLHARAGRHLIDR